MNIGNGRKKDRHNKDRIIIYIGLWDNTNLNRTTKMKLSTLSLLHQEVMKVQNKRMIDSIRKKMPHLKKLDKDIADQLLDDITSYMDNVEAYVEAMIQERHETITMYKNECHRLNDFLELVSKSTLKTIQRELWMHKTHNT